VARLILDIISLDYHETVMAAAGHQAEQVLQETITKYDGKFVCVVEGSIPTKDGGIYCKIGGRTAMEILADVAPKAGAIIAIGNCATYGNVQAAKPNPTGAVGTDTLVKGKPVVNLYGCPPNPISFLGTVLHYLTFAASRMDKLNRRLPGRKIHDQCRQGPFDEGRFAEQFGDAGHLQDCCTRSVAKVLAIFQLAGSLTTWRRPVGVGHGCMAAPNPISGTP
jgi:hydrogenase small subunit/[NiFe] hydrogenase small subunit